jgi:anti-sigma factor RsiW
MNTSHVPIESLIDYLHHELAPGDDAVVMAHVATCSDCHALYDEQTHLNDALRVYGAATERELPAGVVARIWDAVETERSAPTMMQSLAAWFRPMVALPIAAVLALALYVGIAHPKFPGTVAVIDAAYYIDDHAALTGTVPFSEGNVVPPSLENDETGSDQHWVASTGASDVAETH